MKRSPATASLAVCLLAAVILLLSGCAALSPSFEKPQVSLADIQVHEVRTLETAFLIQLRVSNPNDSPLDIQGLSCEVEFDGRMFASGLQGEQQTIPAYGSALVPVVVYASVLDMFSSVINMIQHAGEPDAQVRALNYRLIGTVRINRGGFIKDVPFESEGELNL
jgi:LEA14-like dessication related protein